MCTKMATLANGSQFPCGQCRNCRINRKRDWQARLLLEAATSAFSSFVTLTLGVDNAHKDSYCTYLDKRTVQLFLKRLSKALGPGALRYLVVGEYGTRMGRAHYHCLFFSKVPIPKDVLLAKWGLGSVDIGDVQQESIDYVLAYCLKSGGASDVEDAWDRLRRQRHPEFRLHSQGLGRAALSHLAVPDPDTGELLLHREFRVLGRQWPIGRYFRNKWRGGTLSQRLERGESDNVREHNDSRIERLLHEELRALPVGSPAFAKKREEIQARREAQLKDRQARRIRDYYRDLHQLTERRKNETF